MNLEEIESVLNEVDHVDKPSLLNELVTPSYNECQKKVVNGDLMNFRVQCFEGRLNVKVVFTLLPSEKFKKYNIELSEKCYKEMYHAKTIK